MLKEHLQFHRLSDKLNLLIGAHERGTLRALELQEQYQLPDGTGTRRWTFDRY